MGKWSSGLGRVFNTRRRLSKRSGAAHGGGRERGRRVPTRSGVEFVNREQPPWKVAGAKSCLSAGEIITGAPSLVLAKRSENKPILLMRVLQTCLFSWNQDLRRKRRAQFVRPVKSLPTEKCDGDFARPVQEISEGIPG